MSIKDTKDFYGEDCITLAEFSKDAGMLFLGLLAIGLIILWIIFCASYPLIVLYTFGFLALVKIITSDKL